MANAHYVLQTKLVYREIVFFKKLQDSHSCSGTNGLDLPKERYISEPPEDLGCSDTAQFTIPGNPLQVPILKIPLSDLAAIQTLFWGG